MSKPVQLKCDALVNPLGIDSKAPMLSWRLRDDRFGARQTAYEIQVASSSELLAAGKPDVWDSGRLESDQSAGVSYAGPALIAEKRYFWRVKVWDKDGKPYPVSDASWWETGLRDASEWRGKWIGREEREHRRVREADAAWVTNPKVENFQASGDTHHDLRLVFEVSKTVKIADLFVTGENTAAAWLNGKQVLNADPLPPWGQMPWLHYVRKNIIGEVRSGKNLLGIEVTRYAPRNQRDQPGNGQTPMSATVYIEMTDGSVEVFATGRKGWKSALNATGEWFTPQFDDSSWTEAEAYVPPPSNFGVTKLGKPWNTGPVEILRRSFQVDKPAKSVRLYATALGAYKFHINGKPVGDQILSPGWMDFRQHVAYQVYDVTGDIATGKNAIAAYLAPGWYTTPLQWFGQGYNYGTTPPALKAQLRIEHSDGSVEWVVTDESWKADRSPILFAEIYDGETYDARRVQQGWDVARFDDSHWEMAQEIHPLEPEIVSQYFQPIREEKVLTAKAITNPKPGVFIFDFAQNLSGVPRLRVQAPAGTDIQLRFAEVLNPDGTMYVENLRTAKATDHFITAGKGIEEYQPGFTFHGFRYVEVLGYAGKPTPESLKAVAFHTDAPFTMQLHTGSSMVNQLWNNILWGQRSNFVGVPTDCPQRDERLGWTADAQVFWRAASYNMDLTAFSRKFGIDLLGTQVGSDMYGIFAPGTIQPHPGFGAGWSDAGVVIPWTSWIQNGDKSIIEQNWRGMEKYLAAIESANPDYLWKKNYGIPFGDWLSPEGPTPEDIVATAYWAYDVTLMKQMAHAIGKSDDEKKYGELFEKIKDAFNKAYVRPDGFIGGVPPPPRFASGTDTKLSDKPVDTQTGYVLALKMNLLSDSGREAAAQKLVDKIKANQWRLATGFLGTPYLLEALADTGHTDVAYRLLLSTEYPSWGYLIGHGATTMWERWNGDQMRGDPSMNSYNHYAYGAVADWIYRYAAGVDTTVTDPGFHTIFLHPHFDSRLGNLDLSYQSNYGTIRSAWSVNGAEATWRITIPPNTKGILPVRSEVVVRWSLGTEPLDGNSKIKKIGKQGAEEEFEIPPGSYSFKVKTANP
ncbi:MAG TPA: family 78 glycoside hydrolase catalytic domain [Candidatus Sulfotelmatobacter sp.]|nr:family 78 glycoside hydrolase catalytic domain [Candidatus Sulfotelmatobacter sp.]